MTPTPQGEPLGSRIWGRLGRERSRASLALLGPATIRQPIFMVGTVRSGSTILARCLGDHPRVSYVGFELSAEWSQWAGVPIACPDTEDTDCPRLGPGSISSQQVKQLHRGFGELLVSKGRGRRSRLLNKNPHLSNKMPAVLEAFPDAHMIITSRDLRSTVASTMGLWQKIEQRFGRKHYLPEAQYACWQTVPPTPNEGLEARRLFPGGEVAVIADYWLRTYEAIEEDVAGFASVTKVRHQELATDPLAVLKRVIKAVGLPPAPIDLPEPMNPKRNQRWRQLLDEESQASLGRFIDQHHERITRLTWADTTL